ncbi:Heterokaryon incompatibility protein (HET) domain containing protein [Rhypophila sp. PSN 637]
MPPFTYAQLENPSSQIRLFELIPTSGRRLKGTVIHVDLDAAHGTYDALSYCWGEQNRRVSILVNGHSFYISRNLHAALKNILRQHEFRYGGAGEVPHLVMWIDALCINQDDTEEKNAQVPMMRDIYANGRRTHVWLGPHNIWTALAFREIRMRAAWERERERSRDSQESGIGWWRWRQIHQNRRSSSSHGQAVERQQQHSPTSQNDYYYDEVAEEQDPTDGFLTRLIAKAPVPIWLATSSVLSRPWFSRSWVVQEMATSKCITMVCGKYHMDWGNMEMAFKSTSTSPNNSNAAGTSIEILIAIRQSFHNADRNRLETLLWSTNTFQTTDPRDRIFSLFGLVSPDRHQESDTASESSHRTQDIIPDTGIRIDYAASIRDVYIETTIQCLRTSGHVGILAVCLGTRKTKLGDDFPSWVLNPDPSRSDPTGNMSFAWALPTPPSSQRPGTGAGWTASGLSSRCEPQLDKNDTLLGVEGIIVDTVTRIGLEREGFPGAGGLREIYEHAKTGAQNIKCYMQWRALTGVPTSLAARETSLYRGTTKTTHQAFLEIMCPRLPTNSPDEAALAEKHWELSRQFDTFVTSTFQFLQNKKSTSKNSKLSKIHAARIVAKSIKVMGEARFGNREDVAQAADFEATDSFSSSRRFLGTEKGYIGLGGTHASVGDQIVLFAGSPAPFLIRKVEPKSDAAGGSVDPISPGAGRVRYKLICDAYFVDMMAGELWDQDKCESIWLE